VALVAQDPFPDHPSLALCRARRPVYVAVVELGLPHQTTSRRRRAGVPKKALPFFSQTKPYSLTIFVVEHVDCPPGHLATGELLPSHRSFGAFRRTRSG
jgi:hypothetical protein